LRIATTQAQKRAGDISDAFASLSGKRFAALTPEYAALKGRLIRGHEGAVRESREWLLQSLREEVPSILELGSKVILEIDDAPGQFSRELRKRGVAVVRNVVPEHEVLQWKDDPREYIHQNPHTRCMYAPEPPMSNPCLVRYPLPAARYPLSHRSVPYQ
jgi:hypothetical protein